MITFFISSHGFGHASRQIEVINALGARAPGLPIRVRTDGWRALYDRTLTVPVTFEPGPCDTGVVQLDSLRLDAAESIRQAGAFHRTLGARAAGEARALAASGARLVVGDIPPLAFAAAAEAGLPSVALSNFTWDWIYEGYAEEIALAPDLLPAVRAAYARATEAWRMPIGGGFAAFEVVRDHPMIARHARREPAAVRAALDLPADRPLALVSFGGHGTPTFSFSSLDCLDLAGVVFTSGLAGPPGVTPAGVFVLDEARMYALGLRYEDLVGAADVVVTKPGYGILSECIANHTAMLYTSRGRFVEYDAMVEAMPRYLRCQYLDQEALVAGRWRAALEALLAQPDPPETLPTHGADVAAERMLEMIE